MAHRTRPAHTAWKPVHVTMRASVGELRTQEVFAAVRAAFARLASDEVRARREASFRVVHFSVQTNHVHLIVEAADRRALTEGLRGLAISIARRVNVVLHRRGALWRDRYHARALGSPRSVRNALVYVLNNLRKHAADAEWIDPCSSAAWFEGWRRDDALTPELERARARAGPSLVADARTWLATEGWLRSRGRVYINESPARSRR